jgi:hypothetical protein
MSLQCKILLQGNHGLKFQDHSTLSTADHAIGEPDIVHGLEKWGWKSKARIGLDWIGLETNGPVWMKVWLEINGPD